MVSYQTKHRLRRGIRIALLVLAVLLALAILRFVYLERYLVYEKNGVHLDFGGGVATVAKQEETQKRESFPLHREDAASAEIAQPSSESLRQLSGVSVTAAQLLDASQRESLAGFSGNAVLLDVKTDVGKYLYPTALKSTDVSAQAEEIGAFLKQLKGKLSMTRIARLPAFADRAYALEDFGHSLQIDGGALWMDANGSYWLDPASPDTRAYLIAEAKELSRLGFDEIVFDHFDFPQSAYLHYAGDGVQACREAAQEIAAALEDAGISCSFVSNDPEILGLSARGYIAVTDEMLLAELVNQYTEILPGSGARLVFLTASHDSRLADYSALSPWSGE